MAENLSTEDYWEKFSIVLRPNTLVKASTAAARAREKQRSREYVVLEVPEDENGNWINPEGYNRRKSKKVNPQQLENEESEGNYNFGTNMPNHNLCSLTIANQESQKCLQCLKEVCYGLSDLSDADKSKNSKSNSSKGKDSEKENGKKTPFTEMARYMVKQTKDSFVVAYKLNETAFGFHVAEDFLRDPRRISLLDFSAKGRIRIPTVEYTDAAFTQLDQLLNECLAAVDTFEENYPKEKSMICLLNVFAKGVKHLETCADHCKRVFESLLYICGPGMEVLQKFIFDLNSIERSDIIMEVQSLRRRFDEITIALEKLSWKSHLVLHRGRGVPVRFTSASVNNNNGGSTKSTKPKTSSAKQKNVPNKNPAPISKPKAKKTKVKRKKSVVDQFIKNQKKLQEPCGQPEECDSDQSRS